MLLESDLFEFSPSVINKINVGTLLSTIGLK